MGMLRVLLGMLFVMVASPGQNASVAPTAASQPKSNPGALRGKTADSSTAGRTQSPASQAADDAVFLKWLKPLKPLPKVHYSFPIPHEALERRHDPLLHEYVRLTHAASLDGRWAIQRHIEAAVQVCAEVNAAKPAIPATLAINYSPWHRRWRDGQPPTVEGAPEASELGFMQERLSMMKQWAAQANRALGVDIPISAVLLDSEQFYTRSGDVVWNTAIKNKLNKTHRLATELFPKTRIEWYGRGIFEAATDTGWEPSNWFTYDEDFHSFSCSLYMLPEIHGMRERFRRTVALAESKGVTEVTPWVALGSGYRRTMDGFKFYMDWDYDPVYSWQFGAEINVSWYAGRPKFAPWDRAKVVVFYPQPFISRTWTKHFVAYVRGANGVRELPP
jgi:hypothetical protein